MSSEVTQYFVWNKRENKHESGLFNVQADADAALIRIAARRGPDPALKLSVESVTVTRQK